MATSVTITGTGSTANFVITADTAVDAVKAYWDTMNGLTNKPVPTPTPDPPVNG